MLKQPALKLVEMCALKLDRQLLIIYGWRSLAEQALIYQKGRRYDAALADWVDDEPSLIVTRAKPGTTPHNVISKSGDRAAMAFDTIPLNADGTADWEVSIDFWDKLYELSWKVGLDPLGDVIGGYLKADRGHFEEPGWKWKLDGLGLLLPVSTMPAAV